MIARLTVIVLQINYLIAGVVVVETVFAYPGFGRMMLEAAMFEDIALVEAGALVAVLIAVVTNMVGDLAYMLLDPHPVQNDEHPDRRREPLRVVAGGIARPYAPALETTIELLGESTPATVGIVIILAWVALALLAPLIAPYAPNASDIAALADTTPSRRALAGRGSSRARYPLADSVGCADGATCRADRRGRRGALGALLGLVAGYYGRGSTW